MFNASDFIVEDPAEEGVPQLHSHLAPGNEVTFKVGSKVDGQLRAFEVCLEFSFTFHLPGATRATSCVAEDHSQNGVSLT